MYEFRVSGIACDGCVARIAKAVQALDAQAQVSVDRAAGRVTVESGESGEKIGRVISAAGYPAQPAR